MKKLVRVLTCLAFFALVFSCKTTPANNGLGEVSKSVKKPELIDHKNEKFGKEMPEWVSMEREEIEKLERYKESYVFLFESEKSKDLEGSQLWLKNFSAPSELARMIGQRVKDTAAAAVAGNKDEITGYMEELVKVVSEAKLNGFKKESDYWILRRFFDINGKPEGDYYTVTVLYSIPKTTLDKLISDAIAGVDKPKTEEEKKVRDLVNKALTEDF